MIQSVSLIIVHLVSLITQQFINIDCSIPGSKNTRIDGHHNFGTEISSTRHHRDALDLHDAVELEAAIYAASKFAAHSRTFSVNMCSKIAEMIRGPATPVPVQLQLIPVLQYMHHDASVIVLKHPYYSFKVSYLIDFFKIYIFRLRPW